MLSFYLLAISVGIFIYFYFRKNPPMCSGTVNNTASEFDGQLCKNVYKSKLGEGTSEGDSNLWCYQTPGCKLRNVDGPNCSGIVDEPRSTYDKKPCQMVWDNIKKIYKDNPNPEIAANIWCVNTNNCVLTDQNITCTGTAEAPSTPDDPYFSLIDSNNCQDIYNEIKESKIQTEANNWCLSNNGCELSTLAPNCSGFASNPGTYQDNISCQRMWEQAILSGYTPETANEFCEQKNGCSVTSNQNSSS